MPRCITRASGGNTGGLIDARGGGTEWGVAQPATQESSRVRSKLRRMARGRFNGGQIQRFGLIKCARRKRHVPAFAE